MSLRSTKAIVAMLNTTSQPLAGDPQLIASILQTTLAGVSRKLLESPAPEKHLNATRHELIMLARAYLTASATP